MSNNSNQDYSVSVVIPAYNSEKFIARSIDSVLAQTLLPNEIIVIDDGSTDGTKDAVAKYGDKVKYVYQDNAGAGAARNAGIKAADSTWIAFLDADDEWLPKYLETQILFLKKNTDLNWVYANCTKCLCQENRRAPQSDSCKAESLFGAKSFKGNYFRINRIGFLPSTPTMVIKKSVIEEVGYFDEELHVAQDYDLWWRIAHQNPIVGYTSTPLTVVHMGRSDSLTSTHKTTRGMLQINLYKKHLELASGSEYADEFKKYLSKTIKLFIRSRLFYNQPDVIKTALKEFDCLLGFGYKLFIHILMWFPKTTANICHLISRVVRTFNLRKGVYRRP